MLKIVQRSRDSRLDLAGDSRVTRSLQAAKSYTRAKHARSWSVMLAVALQDKSPKLAKPIARNLNSQLSPVARPSRQTTLFGKNWLFAFFSHLTIYRPLYPRNIESFQREFWEKNPREKQDWLIHNLYIETFQIPLLSSSPLLHPWEAYYQNFFFTIPIFVRKLFGALESS